MFEIDISTYIILILFALGLLVILFKLLQNPDFGIWALILLFPFTQLRVVDTPFGSLQASQLLVVVTLVSLLLRDATKRDGIGITDTPINKAVVLFLLVCVFSLAQLFWLDYVGTAQDLPLTRSGRVDPLIRGLTTILNIMIGMATYYLIVNRLKVEEAVKKGIVVWLASGALAAVIGLYVLAGSLMGSLPKLPLSLVGGQSGLTPRELDMINPINSPLVPRIASVLQEPRHLAIYLAPIVFFFLIMFKNQIYLVRPRIQNIMMILTIATFILTLSRVTFVLAAAILIAYLWASQSSRKYFSKIDTGGTVKYMVFFGIPVLFTTNFLLNYLVGVNFFDFAAFSWASVIAGERLSYFGEQMSSFQTAWQAFIDYPILGGGIGSFYFFTKIFQATSGTVVVNNVYLEVLAETGLLGIVAFFFILITFFRGLSVKNSQDDLRAAQIILAFRGSFFILLVGYMFYSAFFYPYVWGLMGLATAFMLSRRTVALRGDEKIANRV